jgi:hypothetical protein
MLDKKEAIRELARRELASRRLEDFTRYTLDSYVMTASQGGLGVHRRIIEKLEAVEAGRIKRLAIFLPPRIGKSELASIRFPTWCLGRQPDRRIVLASYGAELASDFGRKARAVTRTQEYRNIFPEFALSDDKKEGGNWETSAGGGMYTTGVGGSLTGKGFSIGLIDDAVKDRQDAESETIQKRTIEWYTSTFFTRRMTQDAAIVLMMTRWSEYDLAGYLLEQAKQGGEQWEVLSIPAIDAQGNEILWPGKWDSGYFKELQKNVPRRDWAALYQQDPIGSASNIFKMSDLRYFKASDFERADGILKKDDLVVKMFIDPAFSSSATADDAAIVAIGRHTLTGNLYVLDGYADTAAPSHTFEAALAMWDHLEQDGFKPRSISVESVPLSRDQNKFIIDFKEFLKSRGRYVTVNEWKPVGKKEDRIRLVLEPRMSLHGLHIRSDMPDNQFLRKFEKQLRDFPNGNHDDVIDVVAQGVEVSHSSGQLPPGSAKPPATFYNRQTGKLEPIRPGR